MRRWLEKKKFEKSHLRKYGVQFGSAVNIATLHFANVVVTLLKRGGCTWCTHVWTTALERLAKVNVFIKTIRLLFIRTHTRSPTQQLLTAPFMLELVRFFVFTLLFDLVLDSCLWLSFPA